MKKYHIKSRGFLLLVTCIISIIILAGASISTRIINSKMQSYKKDKTDVYEEALKTLAMDELSRVAKANDGNLPLSIISKNGKIIWKEFLNKNDFKNIKSNRGYKISSVAIGNFKLNNLTYKNIKDRLYRERLNEDFKVVVEAIKKMYWKEKTVVIEMKINLFYTKEGLSETSLEEVSANFE